MSTNCPESQGVDWAYLNTYLTSPLYDDLRDVLEISIMKTNVDDFETKDISSVTENEACNKIKAKLDSDSTPIQSDEEYRRVFFKVNDYYLVLYPRIKPNGKDIQWPINVLNSNFKIVANYFVEKE